MTEQNQPITSAAELINLLVNWHTQVIAEINHLASIPESEGLEITDEDTGEKHLLEGKERQAFIQGLLVAKTYLHNLPFTLEEVNETQDSGA